MPFFQILELGNTYMYANALHLAICKFILVLVLENTSYKMLKKYPSENPYKQKKFKKASIVTRVLYCCTILPNSLISKDD